MPRRRRIRSRPGPGATATSLLLHGVSTDGRGDECGGASVLRRLGFWILVRFLAAAAMRPLAGLLLLRAPPSEAAVAGGIIWRSFGRVCREGFPWWPVFLGGIDEAKAATAQRNVVSRLLPHSGGAFLRRRRWCRGVLCWRSGLVLLRLGQVILLLVSFFFKGMEHASEFEDGGWLDLSQPSLGGGGRRWRA
ncbi:hypothetical protein PVAP13_7KG277755 [Panicum virgatum]|uniref:Uncharacterized protein n=1 Tax=Panicum virgatum TaxID=38727 RepID=A0A8T0QJV3_PANVG|nr:hypothetical protein PVAP13_7KG277755 [Panicum virgatum]